MKIRENIRNIGEVQIVKKNTKTGRIKKVIKFNRLTDIALNRLIDVYSGTCVNMVSAYVAFGDDNTAVSDSDEQLYNEVFRVPIISRLKSGTGQQTSRAILLDYEPDFSPYNGEIEVKEIGFFVGTSAMPWNDGEGKDTGLMLSRIVLSGSDGDKLSDEELEITRIDTMSRG